VSRAYYAAFCHALSHAERKLKYERRRKRVGSGYSEGDDHGALPAHYLRLGKPEIADALKQMREQRNNCDYDDEVEGLSTMADECLDTANDLINLLTWPPTPKID
jgi:hypothetical protein